ncbi:hypothetical protein ABZ016_09595 [Streptomyces sp. NPDC006372]|uniref:hypothetical protein n=1 Tax=Streptomyces sp. NPDC006372 TaxID=3155599 RepID=UPI0033BD4647
MAHAAPASPNVTGQLTQRRTRDVFSARTHTMMRATVTVALGLLYGYWAAAVRRDAGPITGWNVLFGFVTAFVFAVLYAAVWQLGKRQGLVRELHAALWFVFTGCAVGFLVSQANATVLWSATSGVVVGAGVFVTMFYRYYTHEDAAGHRIG